MLVRTTSSSSLILSEFLLARRNELLTMTCSSLDKNEHFAANLLLLFTPITHNKNNKSENNDFRSNEQQHKTMNEIYLQLVVFNYSSAK